MLFVCSCAGSSWQVGGVEGVAVRPRLQCLSVLCMHPKLRLYSGVHWLDHTIKHNQPFDSPYMWLTSKLAFQQCSKARQDSRWQLFSGSSSVDMCQLCMGGFQKEYM